MRIKRNKLVQRYFLNTGIFILVLGFVLGSCTKYPDPAPYFEEFDSTTIPMKRKVLLVVVDGMAGPEIKKIQPPFIMSMLEHSKYSWQAMTDKVTTDAATWESLMTGLSVTEHQIRDSSFEITPDQDHLEENIPVYPTFISRLRATNPMIDMFAASPWPRLNRKLLANVDVLVDASDDKEVMNRTLEELEKGESDFLIANFHGVNIAGKKYGFSAESSGYAAAVNTVDKYIKKMVKAISDRPDYANEQWLVIVTSNHGGKGQSYGGKSLQERRIFTAYYNPHFKELNIPGPDYTQGVKFYDNTGELSDAGAYNIGSSGEYTIMLRVKPTDFGSNNPAILSKTDVSYGGGNPQWTMMFTGGNGRWRSYFVSNSGSQLYLPATTMSLNEWHTLTLKIYKDSGRREAAVFTDGQFNNSIDITGYDFSNDQTLKIGNIPGYGGGSSSEYIQDIRIWNAALPNDIIDSLSCNPNAIDLLNNYENDLIGYWPGNSGDGLALENQVSSEDDFELTSDSKWTLISDYTGCVVAGDKEFSLVEAIRNRDIAPQLFYWFRLDINSDWNWEGSVWLNWFEKEFYNKRNIK